MKHHKLRIAWSLTWGIVALLLVVLWVASYWVQHRIMYPTTSSGVIEVDSAIGVVWLQHYYLQLPANWSRAVYQLELNDDFLAVARDVRQQTTMGFGKYDRTFLSTVRTTVLPHWFLALLSAAVAYVPWLPWSSRFGLRTLLIAMTLVAVGVALCVWITS